MSTTTVFGKTGTTMVSLRSILPPLVGSMLMAAASPASAEETRIGAAALIEREVHRIDGGRHDGIGVGDTVFRMETVRTGAASAAKLVFSDDTNLAMGATSTVTLDRFVFDDEASYKKAAVTLAKGAFRFSSGGSVKGAYEVKTGNATIGVRGTILDIRAERGRTVVTLVEGAATVCPRDGATICADLDAPGDTAIVTSKGASRSRVPFSFAETACSASSDLCGRTSLIAVAPWAPSTGGLCGR